MVLSIRAQRAHSSDCPDQAHLSQPYPLCPLVLKPYLSSGLNPSYLMGM